MKPHKNRALQRGISAAMLAAFSLTSILTAQSIQYWDPGLTPTANAGKGSGGNGTWATATANWSNGTSDATPTSTNVAAFAGTAGNVALTSAVTAAGLRFDTSDYTIGDGTSASAQIVINAQVTNSQGIVASPSVTGTTLNVASIRLGSAGSGTSIWLQNTDLVDFRNSTIYLSGARVTKISNSSATGTTTFAKFALSDKPTGGTWPNTTVEVNQGNVAINSLASAANATGVLAAYTSTGMVGSQISGTGNGTVTIGGDNLLFHNSGTGGSLVLTFNMASGTLALAHDNALGAWRTDSNTLVRTTTALQMSSGTLTASGGARSIANAMLINGNVTIGGLNHLTVSGTVTNNAANRTLTVNNAGTTTLSGNVFLSNDTTARTLTINNTGTLVISGNIAGGVGAANAASLVTKNDAGTLRLAGTNTYTGLTTANAGILDVSGSLAGGLTIGANATLMGSGTISGATSISGTHAAGNSPGIQTFSNNLTYVGGANVNWELAGNSATQQPNPDAVFDQILVGGTLNFSGATELNLSFNAPGSTVNWNNSFWSSNQSWKIYEAAAVSGFSNLSLTSSNWADSSGNLFNTVLNGSTLSLTQDGGNIYLNYTAAIPEPSTYAALLGLCALGLVIYRRRRAQA